MSYNIAIDGPSGAGKSTLSRKVAVELGFIYVDTGALYRTIGLYIYENNIATEHTENVIAALKNINIEIKFVNDEQRVFLNERDVSADIRKHIISDYASKVSAVPEVRDFLLGMQRKLAHSNDCIMDGRDIGTVVLPDADLKIFLTASPETRAKRRFDELIAKGESVSYEKILQDVIERDNRDMNRKTAPLKVADDAVIVDTSNNTFDQSVDALLKVIKEHKK